MPSNYAIYEKVKRVLESCNTADQLACAKVMLDRADVLLRKFKRAGFAEEAITSLNDIYWRKKTALNDIYWRKKTALDPPDHDHQSHSIFQGQQGALAMTSDQQICTPWWAQWLGQWRN